MNPADSPIFSIIVPTRGRTGGLQRLLDSFKATTADLDSIEIILVIDSDDRGTVDFVYDEFPLKRVVVEPGLNMGALNMAGYEASAGHYIMLLNDDVVVRTQGWDEKIFAAFRSFADGIVLVHVNDRIFEEKLCTFPFVSRKYCELAGGICPRDYVRYRIDDHIYNVFNLLAVLGKVRILYLPDVVFQHTNHVVDAFGRMEYQPDEKLHRLDTNIFDNLLGDRKSLALRLIAHIDNEFSHDRARIRENLLNPVTDSVALRRPEYVRIWSERESLSSDNTRVTIGVVTANLRSDHARTCVDLIKKYTKNYDLIILDNSGRPTFNHPHEMNKLLSICDTDYLVLMDDDIFVEAGWLDAMFRCIAPSVGVITPLHKDLSGNVSYAGVVMRPDYSGHHSHSFKVPDQPVRIQTLCSAVMLIDMSKCGSIRFDESYSKYFLDIDYGLQVWSGGYEVVCSPYTIVTHIGGATLQQGSSLSNNLFEVQRQHFRREWIETGRYRKLEQGIWQDIAEIRSVVDLSNEIEALIEASEKDRRLFRERALNLFRSIKNYPALTHWVSERLSDALENNPAVEQAETGHLRSLLGCLPQAILIDQDFKGFSIILYNSDYYAIPQTEGPFDYGRVIQGNYSRYYHAETLGVLKARVRADLPGLLQIYNEPKRPVLVEENDNGLNIILFNKEYYAIPQSEGAFDVGRFNSREYSRSYRAKSIEEVKRQIHSKVWRMLRNERPRNGSRKSIIKSLTKNIVKNTTKSIFGEEFFLQLKSCYLQVKAEKQKGGSWLPALMFGIRLVSVKGVRCLLIKMGLPRSGVRTFVECAGEKTDSLARSADPQRWLNGSPITLIEPDYRGYAIYRYEYKFFGVLLSAGSPGYDDFKRGNYDSRLIGHSLTEIRAAIDQLLHAKKINRSSRGLVFGCLPSKRLKPLLAKVYAPSSTTLLVGRSCRSDWQDYDTIAVKHESIGEWARAQNTNAADLLCQQLVNENFNFIVIPWSFPETWADNSLETVASRFSDSVEILHSSGERRLYRGENLHRLIYNKAYLSSMFQTIAPPINKTVLEAGCSDGLVCDIFSLSGARKVVGIDVMKTVGCGFRRDGIEYHEMDIASMSFPDQSFDITYSIATFEHLADPYKALMEMLRVTKVGGYVYVQAGPLYHSPFGHHMFGYFQDCPWIHLRKSKGEIVSYAQQTGVDKLIERNLSITCEQYVTGMLNRDHLNGLFLEDYGLTEFRERDDVRILKFNVSFEGETLLRNEVVSEIAGIDVARLVEHGFEIAFQRLK